MSFRQFSLNSDVAGFGSKSSLNRSKETSTPINGGSRRNELGYAKALKKAVVKALKGRTKQELACEDVEA